MKKEQEYINIIYKGPNVDDGVIDIKRLASNLLAFANLVQRISAIATEDNAIIDIKIKAVSKGSFNVHLVMEAISSWDGIKQLFATDDYKSIKEILNILGLSGVGASGLFSIYKFLKNKKPKHIKDNNDATVTLTNSEYNELIVSKKLLKVYEDLEVRNSIKEVVKDTLSKDGLNSITFKNMHYEENITKEESKYFDICIDEEEKDEVIENENIAIYSIVSLTFKEDNKWTLNDGNTQIKATIIDEAFLQKIEKGEIAFSKYDKLKCRVLLRQNIKDKLPKNDYTILEVIEHIQSHKQSKLFN